VIGLGVAIKKLPSLCLFAEIFADTHSHNLYFSSKLTLTAVCCSEGQVPDTLDPQRHFMDYDV